ncbi:MAG: hypothetical protein LBQ54_05265 [Planctomycetaceae bacterium]|nr:hypothetical protein [Planctomycetaceae bacterium]
MPPAANARALDPGRLTLTSFGSPSDRKIFPTEAEWNAVTMRQVRSNVLRWRRGFTAAMSARYTGLCVP